MRAAVALAAAAATGLAAGGAGASDAPFGIAALCPPQALTVHLGRRGATVVASGTPLARAGFRSRSVSSRCRPVDLGAFATFDAGYLGAPVYRPGTLACRLPEPFVLETHEIRDLDAGRTVFGSRLTVALDGRAVATLTLRPGGNRLAWAPRFCRRH